LALSGLNKDEEALGAIERALRINPDYAEAQKARNSIYSKLGIALDQEEIEEKERKEKKNVRMSVWTKKEPTSEILKKSHAIRKDWGRERNQRVEGAKSNDLIRKKPKVKAIKKHKGQEKDEDK